MIKIRIDQSSKHIPKKGKRKHSEVSRKVLYIDNTLLRLAGGKQSGEMILTFLEHPENDSNRTNELSPEALLSKFEAHIVESAKTIAEVEVRHCPDWFTMSKKY